MSKVIKWVDLIDFTNDAEVKNVIKALGLLDKVYKQFIETTKKGSAQIQSNQKALVDSIKKTLAATKKLNEANKDDAKAIQQQNAERKALSETYKAQKKQIAGLETQIKKLTKERSAVAKKTQEVNNINKEAIKLQTQLDKLTGQSAKKTAALKLQIQEKRKALSAEAKVAAGRVTLYQKESKLLNDLRNKYKNVALAQGENSRAAKALLAQITPLDNKLKQLDATVGQGQRSVGLYGKSILGVTRQIAGALGFTSAIFLMIGAIKNAFNVVRDFQKGNAVLAGVLNTTRSEITELTEDAKRLGANTAKSATEVNKLQIAYARLGFTQAEIIDLTEDTINGSIALNAELDETAELVGAMVRTFDTLGTQDVASIMDRMTVATQKSALTFNKLQTALPIVSGAANAAGVSFNRTVSLLGKLSDAGIDASSSSTALRNIFIEAASQGLNYEEILIKIGSSQDKLTAANDQFGKRAAVSASILSNLVDEVGEFDEALDKASGTAQRVANEQLDTLDGKLILLDSAWQGLILSIESGEGSLAKFFRGAVEFATDFINALSNVDLLIDVLGKDLDELSDKQINKLLDLGLETDSGKEVKEFFNDLKNLPFDEIVANVDKFRESFVKALVDEGESIEESTRIFNAWFDQRKINFDAQQTFNQAIKDGILTQEQFNQKWAKSIGFFKNGADKLKIINQLYKDYSTEVEGASEETKVFNGLTKKEENAIKKVTDSLNEYEFTLGNVRNILNQVARETEALNNAVDDLTGAVDPDVLSQWVNEDKAALDAATDQRDTWRQEQKEADELAAIIRDTGFAAADIIGNQLFENGKIRRDNELADLQAQKDFELALVGDNAQQKAAIEAKFAAKEKKIKIEAAKAEKKQALFNIALNTAANIVKVFPVVPLIIAAGILGAVQAAAVASKPLPAFEKGGLVETDGNIQVTEKGREMFVDKGGRLGMLQGDKKQVVSGMKGATILPNPVTESILSSNFDHKSINDASSAMVQNSLRQEKDRHINTVIIENRKENDLLMATLKNTVGSIQTTQINFRRGELHKDISKGRTIKRDWDETNSW